jgi:hypothetical protein
MPATVEAGRQHPNDGSICGFDGRENSAFTKETKLKVSSGWNAITPAMGSFARPRE